MLAFLIVVCCVLLDVSEETCFSLLKVSAWSEASSGDVVC